MWKDILGLLREYMGSGLLVLWFLLAEFYLFLWEKRKPFRVLLIYVPLLILLLFFNPYVYRILSAMGLDVYWRLLWLIPFTTVIAFCGVTIYDRLEGRKKKWFPIVAVLVLMSSGSYIYDSPFFLKAENVYHIPQSVVDICDAIEVEGREVRAVFPAELIQYVRQYSPVVCMPYGRDILVQSWGNQDALYDLMEGDEVDAGALAGMARARECHYIVLPRDKSLTGRLQDYAYQIFYERPDYIVYKDATVALEY